VAYSIADFAKSLNLDNCKIQNRPDLLFLCGGPIADSGAYGSARDCFYRYLLKEKPAWKDRIKLAEEVNSWFQKSWLQPDHTFPDLLELENYLANLATVIVLFVESPGSIAELGAFAASPPLLPKTLAVLNTEYGFDKSFIAEGPVLRIKTLNENHVQYYEWNSNKLDSDRTKKEFRQIVQDLTALIEQEDTEREKQLGFNAEETSHTLLLVADLIRMVGVASKSDLADCLNALNCNSASSALDQHLSILQSVGFIAERRRSNQTLYVRNVSLTAFIRYAYRKDAPLKDAQRIKTILRQSLDPIKRGVLSKSIGAGASNA
jgi:hypothetical protein